MLGVKIVTVGLLMYNMGQKKQYYFIGLQGESNELIQIRSLKQFVSQSKHSINVSYCPYYYTIYKCSVTVCQLTNGSCVTNFIHKNKQSPVLKGKEGWGLRWPRDGGCGE